MPVSVTEPLPLPLMTAPPPVATLSVPLVTAQRGGERGAVHVRDRHAGDRQRVSSLTLCAPGTVFTGASFTAVTVIGDRVGVAAMMPSRW